jgi:nicotinic acid mononucleotide adenylyltransferase
VLSDRLIVRVRSASDPVLEVVPDPGPAPAVALLAGSFDPLTVGHEALARAALSRSTVVALVYSLGTLPKEGAGPPPLLPERARLRVLERFCATRRGHFVGLASHGLLSEQAEAAAERFPGAKLFLVMGSDKVLQLLDPKWYADRDAALHALFLRAHVLYAERAGQGGAVRDELSRPENRGWRGSFERMDVAPGIAAVSSRRVRELLRRGGDARSLLPHESWEAVRSLRRTGR